MKYKFDLGDDDSLILVDAEIDEMPFTLAIDTGATHTVIDLTSLLISGYSMSDIKGTVHIETAKGAIEAYIFEIENFKAIGKTIQNLIVCSYDFLANSVFINIDGVIGLDFYRGNILTIDFKRNTINLE